jgi:FAD/FMN-containing dehydrogenase
VLVYGGYGYASRMWGLAVDNIVAMEVVLVDGSIVTASDSHNADLFWVIIEFNWPSSSYTNNV